MDGFAQGPATKRVEAFRETAAQLGMSETIVEKDFWVVWSLSRLFTLPSFGDHLIFKGGTSLSKAYDIISRFSEDIDISLDRTQLGFADETDPEHPDLSSNKRKTLLAELQEAAETTVAGRLLAELRNGLSEGLGADCTLDIDPDDAQTLLFQYPTADPSSTSAYVRPVVRFEFGARGVQLPAENIQIQSYVTEAFPDLLTKTSTTVRVLAVERTFWEKATILHMLYHKDPSKALADRMSRHYYDMAMMIDHETKSRAMGNLALLHEVAHHKSVFFKAASAKYEDAKPGTLRLMPNEALEAKLRRDYAGMQEMIIGDAPGFDDVLGTINEFEQEINATTTK